MAPFINDGFDLPPPGWCDPSWKRQSPSCRNSVMRRSIAGVNRVAMTEPMKIGGASIPWFVSYFWPMFQGFSGNIPIFFSSYISYIPTICWFLWLLNGLQKIVSTKHGKKHRALSVCSENKPQLIMVFRK